MDRFRNHDELTQLDRMHGTAYFSNPGGAEPMQREFDSRLIDEGLDGVDGSSTFERPPDLVMDGMMGKFRRRGDTYASILDSWKTLSTEQMHPLNLLKAVVMSHYGGLVTKARDHQPKQTDINKRTNKHISANEAAGLGAWGVGRWGGGGDGGRVMTGVACCLVIVFSALYETAAL
jgi:hypothetical protein